MRATVGLMLLAGASAVMAQLVPDEPFECSACEAWNQPQEPFQVFGNTWYVGTEGLSSLLIVGSDDDGKPAHILIDGALPQSALVIDSNIRAAGFATEDVRVILNSHEHFDHAGGIAALQRFTGARVIVSEIALPAIQSGKVLPHDPQAGYAPDNDFPAVASAEGASDGDVISVGDLQLTLHLTPGHTPGATSWSWQSCQGDQCLQVVYADSLGPVAGPGFRYDQPLEALHGKTTAEQSKASFDFLRQADCDVFLSPHPFQFHMKDKLSQRSGDKTINPFIVPGECEQRANELQESLDKRLAHERQEPSSEQGQQP